MIRSFARLTALGACCLLPLAVHAEDLNPDTVAKIHADEAKAQEKINAEHGNRKSSEMDSAERKQVIEQERAAKQAVLDKHGVSDKAYERYEAKMSLSERAESKAAAKRIKDKEAADKKTAATPKPSSEPTVQRGFNDKTPVELENKDGQPVVERGLPDEEPPAGSSAPAGKSPGKGKRKR